MCASKSFIPHLFNCCPCNPAEKIVSGYKAWKYLPYIFGWGPCLLTNLLPLIYWDNYCKLVWGVWLLLQEEITFPELKEAEQLIAEFLDGFETIYIQQRTDRIHFVCACVHTLCTWLLRQLILGYNIFSMFSRTYNWESKGRTPTTFKHFCKPSMVLYLQVSNECIEGHDTQSQQCRLHTTLWGPCHRWWLCHTCSKPIWWPSIQQYFNKVMWWTWIHPPNGKIARLLWEKRVIPAEKSQAVRNVKVSCTTPCISARLIHFSS